MRIARTLAALVVLATPMVATQTLFPSNAAALPPLIDPGTIVLPPILPTLYFCNGELATIVGTSGFDTLEGTDGHDVIVGLGGSDWIYDRAGNDTVCAGSGNDVIYGAEDDDWIDGGGGVDTIDFRLAPVPVTLDLRLGRADATGSHDTLIRFESAQGSNHDDVILGTNGDNLLRGGGGRDHIYGRPGYDSCRGEVVRGCEAVASPAPAIL